MSGCHCRFMRCLSSGFMKVVKFALCFGVLMLLLGVMFKAYTFLWFSRDGMLDILPRSGLQLKIYLFMASTFVVSVYGVHGAFCSNSKSLKKFSLLSLLNSLLIFLIFSTISLKYENQRYYKQLEIFMPFYQWIPEEIGAANLSEANLNWDGIQSFQCCGIDSYKDWDKFRPLGVGPNLYPHTCCSHRRAIRPLPPPPPAGRVPLPVPEPMRPEVSHELCEENEFLYRTGCLERTEKVEYVLLSSIFNCAIIFYHLLLAFMASSLSCHLQYRQLRSEAARLSATGSKSPAGAGCTPAGRFEEPPPSYPSLTEEPPSHPAGYGALE